MQSWDVIYESCIGLFVPHQAETGHPGIQTYWMSVMKIIIQIHKYTNTQIQRQTPSPPWNTNPPTDCDEDSSNLEKVERENPEKTESKFKMECR